MIRLQQVDRKRNNLRVSVCACVHACPAANVIILQNENKKAKKTRKMTLFVICHALKNTRTRTKNTPSQAKISI